MAAVASGPPHPTVVSRLCRPAKQGQQPKEQLKPAQDTDNCHIFVDRDGEMIRVMCCDYGFRTGSGRLYQDMYGEVPDNVFAMVSGQVKPSGRQAGMQSG